MVVRFGPRPYTPKGKSADPARSARESGRRAATQVKRLAVEHNLTRLITLTYDGTGQHDRQTCVGDVQRFVKRLRRRVAHLRYVWVLEEHPGGHGWHVHMLIDRFVSKSLIADTWGNGFVDARMIKGNGRQASKSAGRYAAKYVSKDAQTSQGGKANTQRYGRSEGLEIEQQTRYFGTFRTAKLFVLECAQCAVTWFDLTTIKDWSGPPGFVASW